MVTETVAVAQPAGVPALPENIVRLTDRTTMTAPDKCLPIIPPDTARLYNIMAVYPSGDFYGDFFTVTDVTSIVNLWPDYVQVHVYLSDKVGTEFMYDEIRPSLKCLPWLQEPWFRDNFLRWAEMLPRESENYTGLLTYYQTTDKRERNIRTPIKPGRWLKKYFSDVLTETEIHEKALMWDNKFSARNAKITQDADEIERIYRGAYLGSCMHFQHGHHAGDEHPARVYAGPDLGIAYLGDVDCPSARCLVWPDKKIYFEKTYGDGPRLYAALKNIGYSRGYDYDFDGARIQKIEHYSGFVLPYLDTTSRVRDAGDYLVFDEDGSITARETNGLSGQCYSCDECGDLFDDEDDLSSVHDSDNQVCRSCINNDYFRCDISGEYHLDDTRAETPSGYTVAVSSAQESPNWFECEVTEMHYPHRRYSATELVEGLTCELSHAEDNGFYCEYSEQWSLDMTKQVHLTNNTTVHMDSFSDQADMDEYLARVGTEIIQPIQITEAA